MAVTHQLSPAAYLSQPAPWIQGTGLWTICAWVKTTAASTTFHVSVADSTLPFTSRIFLFNNAGNAQMNLTNDAQENQVKRSTAFFVDNAWSLFVGELKVHSSGSYTSISLNGGAFETENSISNMGTVNNTDVSAIGAVLDSTPTYSDGSTGEVAIWSHGVTGVGFSSGELAALYSGASPLSVRPDALIHYYPTWLDGRDFFGGADLSPTGSLVYEEHPPVAPYLLNLQRGSTMYAEEAPEPPTVSILDYERMHRGVSRGLVRGAV